MRTTGDPSQAFAMDGMAKHSPTNNMGPTAESGLARDMAFSCESIMKDCVESWIVGQ
jgi:hypothetical protein